MSETWQCDPCLILALEFVTILNTIHTGQIEVSLMHISISSFHLSQYSQDWFIYFCILVGEGRIIKSFENLMAAVIIASPTRTTTTSVTKRHAISMAQVPLLPIHGPLGRPVIKPSIRSLCTLFKIRLFPKDGLKKIFF